MTYNWHQTHQNHPQYNYRVMRIKSRKYPPTYVGTLKDHKMWSQCRQIDFPNMVDHMTLHSRQASFCT